MTATLFKNIRIFDAINDEAYPGEVLVEGNRIAEVACAPGQIAQNRAISRAIAQFLRDLDATHRGGHEYNFIS